MATVTKTIGTTGRDYSTITLWEADLDDGGIYSSGDDAVGECYNDSAFDESPAVDGGGTIGLASITLTAASGEEHDGTAGSGARIVRTTTGASSTLLQLGGSSTSSTVALDLILSNFEVDANGNIWANNIQLAARDLVSLRRSIIHGNGGTGSVDFSLVRVLGSTDTGDVFDVTNCVLYDLKNTFTPNSSRSIRAVDCATSRNVDINNITIHDIDCTSSTATSEGVDQSLGGATGKTWQNIVITDVTNGGSGSAACYAATIGGTIDHNAASDTTASGTGSLDSIVTADQYVSITDGSEDLHVQDVDADIFEAGTDLATTPTGVNFDIDNYDRDAGATTWSIGAHDGNNLRGVAGPPKTIGFGYGQFVA